jgi:hypothetical protein
MEPNRVKIFDPTKIGKENMIRVKNIGKISLGIKYDLIRFYGFKLIPNNYKKVKKIDLSKFKTRKKRMRMAVCS